MSTIINEENLWDQFSQALSLTDDKEETEIEESSQEITHNTLKKCQNCDADENDLLNDASSGQIVCTQCGFVIDGHLIDDGAEWNNYTDEFGKIGSGERCGPALDPTNPFDTIGTWTPKMLVTCYNSDGTKYVRNLQKLAIRTSYTSKHRAFNEGKYDFEIVVSRLGLGKAVLDDSKIFWGVILKTDILTRGANRRGLKACCVYYAAICNKTPRGRDDIVNCFDITDTKDFSKGEKIFREIFEKNTKYSWILYKNTRSEDMFSLYVMKLGLDFSVTKKMNLISEHCNEHLLGVNTKSRIAGILYYVTNRVFKMKKPNKSKVSEIVGVCNPTLNKVIEIISFFYVKNPALKEKVMDEKNNF